MRDQTLSTVAGAPPYGGAWGESEAVPKPNWKSKATGDMTLSVLDEHGRQILKIDMLRYGTMKAENGGDRLARSLNDLALIAAMPDICHTGWVALDATLPHPEAGLSPFPWSVDYDDASRSLEVRDAAGKKIAGRRFPDRIPRQDVEVIVTILRRGVTIVCR